MAVIVIQEVSGMTTEMADGMVQAGIADQLKSAAGFRHHASGPMDNGYRVIEVWDSPEAFQAWFDGTIKPNLPPGVTVADAVFVDAYVEVRAD